MKHINKEFWKHYIANAQVDLTMVAKTKVPKTWSEQNYTPNFNKLYFIVEGEGYLEVNNQRFFPKPGELYLLPATTKQSYGTVNDYTFLKYWCHFTAKLGELQLLQVLNIPIFITTSRPEELAERFEQLIYYSQKDSLSSHFKVHSILLELLAHFLEHSEEEQFPIVNTPSFEKMDSVVNFIENNLGENLTIDQLAQIVSFHQIILSEFLKILLVILPFNI